jgi:hypothetical protein
MRKVVILGIVLCLAAVAALSDSGGRAIATPTPGAITLPARPEPAPLPPSKAGHVATEPTAEAAPVAKRPGATTLQGKRLAAIDKQRAAEVQRVKGMYQPLGWHGKAATKVGAAKSVELARSSKSLAAANPCDTLPGEPYGVQYLAGSVVQPITNTSNGIVELTVRNTGTNGWGDGSYVGYRLFNAAGTEIPGTYPTTPIPSPFLSGGSVPGSQWHAQGKGEGSPGLNIDGTFHDGDPGWGNKQYGWLRKFGWKIPE